MGRAGLKLAAAMLLGGIMAGPALAGTAADVNARIDDVLGHASRYETVIMAFQGAVAADDKADVAAFVRYPIVVSINGRKLTIRSAAQFVQHYDAIMTPDIVEAIKGQKYGDLFVNDQGVMFGNGQAWLDGVCIDRQCTQSVPKVVTLQHADDN